VLLSARPDFGAAAAAVAADRRALHVHWLGHATFVLQLQGLTVVTDPVWAARLGPMGPRRLVPPPCEVEDLPARIDVVLLSSACYDHLDKHAVERLAPRVSTWIVPLGVKRIVVDCSVEPDAVTELDWWQEVRLPLGGPGPGAPSGTVTVACTPAQNYSPRGDTLWCSFYIRHPHRRVFYCGGSGYRAVSRASDDAASFDERAARRAPSCPAFRDVCQRCGPCDTALLPMGGASPRAQMSAYNMDAVDLLLAHRDLRARRTIAHRWGTFQAGDEGMLDPVRALENAVVGTSSALISEHDVSYLKHGHEHRA
jgi:N-acyl-phosphatidylethanolamine-hydrolysing phospholipase D